MSLTQIDYTDREMVGLVHDCVTDGDYANVLDMASRLGARDDDVHIRRGVAMRLAYMARALKLVKRHPKEPGKWKLTAQGEALRDGSLPKALENVFKEMNDGERVAATTAITQRSIIDGTQQSALMTRRVVTYGFANRRNGRRR